MSKSSLQLKDANAQLQEWSKTGMKPEEQKRKVDGWLRAARPFILHWAEEVGEIDNLTEKTEALNGFFKSGVLALSTEDRAGYRNALCDALQIKSMQWNEHLKALTNGSKKKGEKDDDVEPIFTAGGWFQHHLVEIFYKPEEMRTYLAVRYPDGRISELQDRVYVGDVKLLPMPVGSIITKNTVRLPSEMGEAKSEDELLDLTKKHILKYFDFGGNQFFEEYAPLYVPFSYVYDGFMEVSYLRALGDWGTGKTRFLKAVGMLCYRPIYMSGGSSAASIYSLLDIWRGTLVLNEADFTESNEASMIAKILNGGTERGESVTKMRGSMENMTVESFNVFSPKVIATRKEFNDHAIRSRCLTMEMVPMTPNPKVPQSLPPTKELEDLELRNLWTTFRMRNAQESVTVDESKMDRSLEPRLNQITLSLMMTIKSEETKDKIREFLQEYGKRSRDDRYETFTARVLEGLVLAWAWGPVSERDEDTFRVYMKDIALAINHIVDHQREQLGEDDEDEEKPGGDKKTDVKKTKSRKISGVFTNYLQIKTIRATDGDKEYKGTKFVNMAEEQDRVMALCIRWGVEWMEIGSITEKALADGTMREDDRWMLKPKVVKINLNDPEGTFEEARRQWNNTKPKDEG